MTSSWHRRGCEWRATPRTAARKLLLGVLMKRLGYSISIGIAVIALAGMVATGCGDSGGLQSGKTDGGASDAAASLGGQAGSSVGGGAGSAGTGGVAGSKDTGGVAGSQDTGGVAGSKGTGGAAGSVDAGGVAGSKGTGGMAGSGGTTGSGGTAGGGSGGVDAAVDVSKPDGGGIVDVAADAGAGDAPAPDARVVPDSSVAPDVEVVCGPVCLMYCTYGNVLDENGCELCACNSPPPCPAVKCQACLYGYLHDADGCPTCTCLTDPRLPCSQLDATQCGASANCRWLEPGCNFFGTLPLPAAICHDSAGVGCTPSNPCPDGQACTQRVINPCSGGDCLACGSVVSICL